MEERRRGSPGVSGRGSPYDHAPRRVPAHSTVPVASDSVRLRDVDTSGSADSPAGVRDVPLLHLGSGGMVPPDTADAATRRAMLARAVPKSDMAARTPSRSQEARPTYRLVDEREMQEAVATHSATSPKEEEPTFHWDSRIVEAGPVAVEEGRYV